MSVSWFWKIYDYVRCYHWGKMGEGYFAEGVRPVGLPQLGGRGWFVCFFVLDTLFLPLLVNLKLIQNNKIFKKDGRKEKPQNGSYTCCSRRKYKSKRIAFVQVSVKLWDTSVYERRKVVGKELSSLEEASAISPEADPSENSDAKPRLFSVVGLRSEIPKASS